MNRILFLLSAVLSVCSVAAQNYSSVKGVVFSESGGDALQYVTVAVMDTSGRVIGGATTDSLGMYSISVSGNTSESRLLVSFVGYVEQEHPLSDMVETSSGGTAVLKDIFLKDDAQMLAGAVVSDKRQLLEHHFDRIVLNVSELAVARTGNALDVLKSSPGVTVDKDGNIKLNGQTVSVWIDGRPSQMSGKDLEAYLQGSTGDAIEKVELISNPSAKYDAEGSGGIINIKTKKGFMKGLNGSVRLAAGVHFLPKASWEGSISANLMYKTDKTSTAFSYSPGYWGDYDGNSEQKRYGDDYSSFQETGSFTRGDYMGHNISLGNDWKISRKDVLGVNFRVSLSDNRSKVLPGAMVTDYRNYGTGDQYIWSVLNGMSSDSSKGERYSLNLNYTRTFDESKAQELTINADYNRNMTDGFSMQKNVYDKELSSPDAEGLKNYGFRDGTLRILDLYSFKADYSQNFWKETGRIEAGVKAAVSDTRNRFSRFDYIPETLDDLSEYPSERNDFTYDEQVYAAYFNVAKQFSEKWNAQIGVRGEYTVQQGDWMTGIPADGAESGSTKTYKDYFDAFPSAYVCYMPSQKAILTANYSYRLSRPKYWQMNPFRSYMNATTYSQGNPLLLPSYSHNVSLSAVLFSRLTLTAGYSHNRNYSDMQVPVLDRENGMMGLIYANAGVQQYVFGAVSLSELPLTKWWNLTLNANYSYVMFNAYSGIAEGIGGNLDNRGGQFSGFFSTTFFLPESFKISLDGWGVTSQTAGYYRFNPMMSLNFNVEKTFLDGDATLALRVNDFANTMKFRMNLDTDGIRTYSLRNGYGKIGLTMSFTWRFGKSSGNSRRNVGSLEEDSRM